MNKRVAFYAIIGGLIVTTHAFADNTAPAAKKNVTVINVKKVDPEVKLVKKVDPEVKLVKKVPPEVKLVKKVDPEVKLVKKVDPVLVKPAAEDDDASNPAICFARGLSNISLCWLEIPRCAVYDNYKVPFFGLIVGIPEGAILTVARVGSGLVDVLSLGFSGNAIHGKRFPEYIWQAPWKPAKK